MLPGELSHGLDARHVKLIFGRTRRITSSDGNLSPSPDPALLAALNAALKVC
jgi:hypothetical protein